MTTNSLPPIPPPPDAVTDPDRITAGENRWANCPLKDCKRNHDLLYEDFYLRSIRSDRLMCSACVVRAGTGYMAREEAKAHDDRFFQGTQLDNAKTFGVMLIASLIANVISLFIGFFYFAFLIGGAAGGIAAPFARQLSGGRATREQHYVGAAGIVAGALLTAMFLRFDLFSLGACSIGMGMAAWGILQRKI